MCLESEVQSMVIVHSLNLCNIRQVCIVMRPGMGTWYHDTVLQLAT